MKKWELIGGIHQSLDGTNRKAGDIIESDEDLAAQYVGKFRQVMGDPVTVTTAAPINMTAAFPGAAENGYAIFAVPGGLFNVSETGTPQTPINPAPAAISEIMSFLQTEHISALSKPEADPTK